MVWATATSQYDDSSPVCEYTLLAKIASYSIGDLISVFLWLYVALEVVFYVTYRCFLIPKANEWVEPHPYRDYGKNRHLLVVRILRRVVKLAKFNGTPERQAIKEFILSNFDPTSTPSGSFLVPDKCKKFSRAETQSTVSTDSHDNCTSEESQSSSSGSLPDRWTIPELGKDDLTDLISWACFGKKRPSLESWELEELEKGFEVIEEQFGLFFQPGSTQYLKARRLSVEDVDPLPRPLLVYLVIMCLQAIGSMVLQFVGFRRTVSKPGLVAWYRPAKTEAGKDLRPTVFFHGLAPAGFFFYLPILFYGLFNDDRAYFIFTIPNISCRIGFRAWTETEFVDGVAEIVNYHLPKDQPLTIIGHSFGSVPMTWLLMSPILRTRIKQFVLLDPVTILLSEKDVMVNFLYKKDYNRIHIMAASELFTEYFLRRHFFFYNSELWLEDIPESTKALVFVAEKDEIVNGPRVKTCIDCHLASSAAHNLQFVYWENASHAAWVSDSKRWKEIKTAIVKQECQP